MSQTSVAHFCASMYDKEFISSLNQNKQERKREDEFKNIQIKCAT